MSSPALRHERARRRGIERDAFARRPNLDPALGVGLVLDGAAVDDLRLAHQPLDRTAAHVERTADEDDRRVPAGASRNSSSRCSSSSAALLSRFGMNSFSASKHDHDATRHHHRQRARRVDEVVHLHFAAVHALDVERAAAPRPPSRRTRPRRRDFSVSSPPTSA